MGSTRLMWVGLNLCDGLDWVEFFLTHHGGLGQKTRPNLTQPDPCTPLWVGSKNSTQPNTTRPMHTPKGKDLLQTKL